MNKKYRSSVVFPVLAAALSFGGCAPTLMKLEPVATGKQKVVYQQGKGLLVSARPASVVGLETPSQPQECSTRVSLVVAVQNLGAEQLDVSEANLIAEIDGEPARVISAAELAAEAVDDARGARFGLALAAAFNSAGSNAGRATTTSTTTINSQYGQRVGELHTVSNTYDANAAAAAHARDAAEYRMARERVASREASTLAHIQASAFARTTLVPGSMAGGMVTVQSEQLQWCSDETKFLLKFKVGDDEHVLRVKFTEVP